MIQLFVQKAGMLHVSQLEARHNQTEPAALSTAKTRSWKKSLMPNIPKVPVSGVDPQTAVVMEDFLCVIFLASSRQMPTNYIKYAKTISYESFPHHYLLDFRTIQFQLLQ
jgi:hypothetical protein